MNCGFCNYLFPIEIDALSSACDRNECVRQLGRDTVTHTHRQMCIAVGLTIYGCSALCTHCACALIVRFWHDAQMQSIRQAKPSNSNNNGHNEHFDSICFFSSYSRHRSNFLFFLCFVVFGFCCCRSHHLFWHCRWLQVCFLIFRHIINENDYER